MMMTQWMINLETFSRLPTMERLPRRSLLLEREQGWNKDTKPASNIRLIFSRIILFLISLCSLLLFVLEMYRGQTEFQLELKKWEKEKLPKLELGKNMDLEDLWNRNCWIIPKVMMITWKKRKGFNKKK